MQFIKFKFFLQGTFNRCVSDKVEACLVQSPFMVLIAKPAIGVVSKHMFVLSPV